MKTPSATPVDAAPPQSRPEPAPGSPRTTHPIGWWTHDAVPVTAAPEAVDAALRDLASSIYAVLAGPANEFALGRGGQAVLGAASPTPDALPIVAICPPIACSSLGDAEFRRDHGVRHAYVTGAMANAIASCDLVEAVGRAGMLGFFGAAGLPPREVEAAIDRIQRNLGDHPYGFNLIHTPNEPSIEQEIVDLYLRRGIRRAEASAYLDLTLPAVRFRVHGIHRGADGRIVTPQRLIAKVSRVEVAARFFAPPPDRFLSELVARGELTAAQADLARQVPMAQDVTAEADSGGHTDNRPAICLLPTLLALRDRVQREHGFAQRLRVGAAGGIATPQSVAAAFAMGAAYVVTGSINQACVESGTSDLVRRMLAEAGQADVAMAPAADMFEMGVRLQVLKRGTMFAMRAARLYELYRAHDRFEDIPAGDRANLEKNHFRAPAEQIWESTKAFFLPRDPSQIERAERDPKHKMALLFRWYLGLSSHWANAGEASRKMDFQVWCGPAMGAFNEWARGTPLERPENRRVVDLAHNLLYGAAVAHRANVLRSQGVTLPEGVPNLAPVDSSLLKDVVN